MMFRRVGSLLIIGTALLVAGCNGNSETVGVNLDFAKTNFGYVNSGGYRAGSFFRWDFRDDRLVYLADIPGFEKPVVPQTSDRVASYQAGVDVDASLSAIQKFAINAEIARRSTFKVSAANRVPYSGVYTRITRYLNMNDSSSGGLADEWQIKRAISERDAYFVIVRDVTYGDELSLTVDGEIKSSAEFPVKVADASYNVKISGRGLEQISGDNTELLFNIYVLEPSYLIENRGTSRQTTNFQFEVISGVDLTDLPQLFRAVGDSS